jgi:hydantoinase/carbamoylase family amidase
VDATAAVAAHVDTRRVLERLDALAEIGAIPGGGVTRVAFSEEERVATDLVAGWIREAGLTVAFDGFGNMFGSTDANGPGARVSMAGSHLDTVRNGGRFDGALGVVAALEAVLAMTAAGRRPPLPLEVVVWRCEEPVRFSQGRAGSLVFSGQVRSTDLRPIEDPPLDLAASLALDGTRPQRAADRSIATCLELHIEQGRRLERAGRRIGVVTAVAAPIRLRATIRGSADHSGATPMSERRDALCAAAELVLAVERCALAESEHESVATAADLSCRPGVINVIPGEATLLIDVRGIDVTSMQRLVDAITRAGHDLALRRGVAIQIETLSRGKPAHFSPYIISALGETVRALGEEPLLLPSGAGHDVQCLADMAATGMLFVPSVGGISHSPHELTLPEDVVAGARALAACWWVVASRLDASPEY